MPLMRPSRRNIPPRLHMPEPTEPTTTQIIPGHPPDQIGKNKHQPPHHASHHRNPYSQPPLKNTHLSHSPILQTSPPHHPQSGFPPTSQSRTIFTPTRPSSTQLDHPAKHTPQHTTGRPEHHLVQPIPTHHLGILVLDLDRTLQMRQPFHHG